MQPLSPNHRPATGSVLRTVVAIAMAVSVFTAMPASATPQLCDYADAAQWIPKTQVEQIARERGYSKFFIQPDGGCWGIYTTLANGLRWRVLLDPRTGAIVKEGES